MRFYIEEVSDVCRYDVIPYFKENKIDLNEWRIKKYDEENNIVSINIYLSKTEETIEFKFLLPNNGKKEIKEVEVIVFKFKSWQKKSITIDYSKENYRFSLFKLIVSEILECYGLL